MEIGAGIVSVEPYLSTRAEKPFRVGGDKVFRDKSLVYRLCQGLVCL